MGSPHITIVGRFDPEYAAHVATREAIIHAESELGVVINTRWVIPEEIDDPEELLADSCGAFLAPRNPKSPRQLWPEILGVLGALRRKDLPTLAVEYGYQHMVISMARDLLGRPEANSSAYDESTPAPVIQRLHPDDPLDEFKAVQADFEILPDTALARAYGRAGSVREMFRGHYVLNPDYAPDFEAGGIPISARGRQGDAQFLAAVELPDRRFFMGVAWLPQTLSRPGRSHPLIRSFVAAVVGARGR